MSPRTKGLAALGAVMMGFGAAMRAARAYRLRDSVALVTGGSRGLGLLIARELVAQGARVAICARDAEELERAAEDLRARGGRVCTVVCDLTRPEMLRDLVARVTEELGPIDVLVNNAGVIEVGPIELMTREDYENAMAVHVWAPLQLIQAVAPQMTERGGGRIVNIASIGGRVPVPHLHPYVTSKFALVGLSEGARVELAPKGIAVTTVLPGLMRTGSARNARFKGQNEAEYTWFAVGASMPGIAIAGDRAARRIVRALRHGEAEVVLSVHAKIASKLAALAPGLTQAALALVNRMLPGPGGIGAASAAGYESETPITSSWVTHLGQTAARRNNEV